MVTLEPIHVSHDGKIYNIDTGVVRRAVLSFTKGIIQEAHGSRVLSSDEYEIEVVSVSDNVIDISCKGQHGDWYSTKIKVDILVDSTDFYLKYIYGLIDIISALNSKGLYPDLLAWSCKVNVHPHGGIPEVIIFKFETRVRSNLEPALSYEEFIDLAKQYYMHGGDVYVECWGKSEFFEYTKDFGDITRSGALKMFGVTEELDKEYQAAADYFSGEY